MKNQGTYYLTKYLCKMWGISLFPVYHPSLFSSTTADSAMQPTMHPTRDGVSTNDAKFLSRYEPQKASLKWCGRFKRVKEKGQSPKIRV